MGNIMIVDDNPGNVKTMKLVVEKEGHKATCCSNGEEFLQQVESVHPDLVLLDVMMPGPSTKEILKELKEKKLDQIKVILVTVVRAGEEYQNKLKSTTNVVDYITKPFDIYDLASRVNAQLK